MDILVERVQFFRIAICTFAVVAISGCAMSGTRESVPVELSGNYAVPTEVSTSGIGKATIEVTNSGAVFGHVMIQNVSATAVELGEGPIGQQGTVIASLINTGDNTWVIPHGVRLTPAQYDTFMAGGLYINVRSATYPEGEMRGQITPAACRFTPVETVEAAPSPPPPPPPAPPETPPPPLTTSTDFDFDKATLRTTGKMKLDDFANALRNQQYNAVHVTGYTDRIGTEAYNQSLSTRRAESVKNYLIDKGVPDERIETEGRGKNDPLTGDTCNGINDRNKLIDCLQPDRRVEVKVH